MSANRPSRGGGKMQRQHSAVRVSVRVVLMHVALGIVATSAAEAQSPCDIVASLGWYRTSNAVIDQTKWSNLIHLIKDDQAMTWERAQSITGSISVPIEGVMIAAGFGSSKESYDTFKSSRVDYTQKQYYDRFASHIEETRVDESAASVLNACFAQEGVWAYVSQDDDNDDEFTVRLDYSKPSPNAARTTVTVTPGTGVTGCKPLKRQQGELTADLSYGPSGTPVHAFTCKKPPADGRGHRITFNAKPSKMVVSSLRLRPRAKTQPPGGCPSEPLMAFSVGQGTGRTFCGDQFSVVLDGVEGDRGGWKCKVGMVQNSTNTKFWTYTLTDAGTGKTAIRTYTPQTKATITLRMVSAEHNGDTPGRACLLELTVERTTPAPTAKGTAG